MKELQVAKKNLRKHLDTVEVNQTFQDDKPSSNIISNVLYIVPNLFVDSVGYYTYKTKYPSKWSSETNNTSQQEH